MVKIGLMVKKAIPFGKKLIVPAIIGMFSGAAEAATKQKAAEELMDIKSRLADLEKLVKKD